MWEVVGTDWPTGRWALGDAEPGACTPGLGRSSGQRLQGRQERLQTRAVQPGPKPLLTLQLLGADPGRLQSVGSLRVGHD